MNVRGLIFMGLLLIASIGLMQAQTYERQWKKVEELEKKDLPKSVVEAAQTIYVKAEKEKNVPQMMKAFLTMMAYRNEISPDSLQVDLQKMEAWASSSQTSVPDKAVLYSIMGEIILLKGMDALQEEADKANDYLKKSLQDSLVLVNYDAEKLTPLVVTKETSKRYFNNNLYELLARRAISIWKKNIWRKHWEEIDGNIKRTYQSLLNIYQEKGMREAWLLTALDAFPNADEKTLRQWMKNYGDLEVCAEVYLKLANSYQTATKERLALLREALVRYPDYERIQALKEFENWTLRPQLSVSFGSPYPNETFDFKVSFYNLPGFTLQMYRLDLDSDSPLLSKVNADNVTQFGKLVKEEHFMLELSENEHKLGNLTMNAPEAGLYFCKTIPDGRADASGGGVMRVSSLQLIARSTMDNRIEMVVLDKRSGHPIPDAKVFLYVRKGNDYVFQKEYVSDVSGKVFFHKEADVIYCKAGLVDDKYMPIIRFVAGVNRYQAPQKEEKVHLFSDRSIYRPGQVIQYSGLAYTQEGDVVCVAEGRSFKVGLYDANRQEIGRTSVQSDTFGTFHGTFVLPEGILPGDYRLQVNGFSMSIRVEEYKRPTFEVGIESPDMTDTIFQVGDTIRLQGWARSFSGVPIQEAVVKYTILGRISRIGANVGTEQVRMTGETVTDREGFFNIPIQLRAGIENVRTVYTYEISADVTNKAGETQNGRQTVSMGGQTLRIFVDDWKEKTIVREQKKTLKFSVINQLHQPVQTEVVYRVYGTNNDNEGGFVKAECLFEDKVISNQPFVPEKIYTLPSGRYILKAVVKDDNGHESEEELSFVQFSLKDKDLPYETKIWSYQTEMEFSHDHPTTIYLGSSEKNVYLFYDVFADGKHLERKNLIFSDSLLHFHFSYKAEYGDGIQVGFAFMKDGELHTKNMRIVKPKPDKGLDLTWRTFRDKLKPGEKETWVLNVVHKDGTPADAQLLANMYDASLDQFVSHRWNFDLSYRRKVPFVYWEKDYYDRYYWASDFSWEKLDIPVWEYSYLAMPDVPFLKNEMEMFNSFGTSSVGRVMKSVAYSKAPDSIELEEGVWECETVIDRGNSENINVRTNFAETAFFYPQLRTNKKGEVSIEFTLPESLTTWRFMGLAHTRDMDYGELSASVTASKDFMLQPNLPRFVRMGDEVTLTASLMNLTAKGIKGTVRMELFNPETDKVWMVQKKDFRVGAKNTEIIQFSFKVKDEYEVLACRMIADGGKFSDGEQRYLPVLSDKRWMTESVSIDVDKAGTYRIPLEKLFNHHSNTVTHPRMFVEFTGNPAWYAIQTLPVLVEPENENAYSWASAFYANTLARYLFDSNPKIRQVVESWKAQEKDALLSPLQKNEELKGMLLEETPWLADGMDETKQKQQLLTLFDTNVMNYRYGKFVSKLKELQNEDGSWSWYKGMSGNRYMTTQIIELLARLRAMVPDIDKDQEMNEVYRKGFEYLKKQAREEYKRMRESEKEEDSVLVPSEQILRYLYICTLDSTLQVEKEVNDYLIHTLEPESARLTIYGKSLASIIYQHAGRMEKAEELLCSVMEYSVVSEEMGRYFDTEIAPYSWFSYKIPTEVMVIEALTRLGKDKETVEQMKRWLLKQKQTQAWDMPIATVDAVYALLMTGYDWLEHAPSAEIVLGEEVIQVSEQHALGYLKEEVDGNVTTIENVVVRKKSDGMAWGAVYAQYLEQMDKVETFSNTLSVSRTLLKNGKVVSPDALKVGDRITVRLIISVDRDMDFVQIKDERAACMEPVDVFSSYCWRNGVGYYQVTKDASTFFFFDQMRKGMHVLEYDVFIMAEGEYLQGIVSAQSVYAPEFGGHSVSQRMRVK